MVGIAVKRCNALILLKCARGGLGSKVDQSGHRRCVAGESEKDRSGQAALGQGLEASLDKRKPERTYRRKADGDFEAHLIAGGKPPPGHARWSLRLLADRMVELEYVDAVSYETVRRVLKKTN